MAVDEYLLERIRGLMNAKHVQPREIKMFGGVCFMVEEKMCFGTYRGGLMARVGPGGIADLALREGAEQMLHGGREMKGFLWVDPMGYDSDRDLEFWIDRCLEYNPKATSSKSSTRR